MFLEGCTEGTNHHHSSFDAGDEVKGGLRVSMGGRFKESWVHESSCYFVACDVSFLCIDLNLYDANIGAFTILDEKLVDWDECVLNGVKVRVKVGFHLVTVGIHGMHAKDETEGHNVFGDHSMAEDVVAFGFQPSKHIWTILDLAEGESRHDSEVKLEAFAHGIRLKVVDVSFNLHVLWDFASLGDVSCRFVV